MRDSIMTDLKLNEAVARKLGYVHTVIEDGEDRWVWLKDDEECKLPAYSTSIEAAWEIVEKLFVVKLEKVSSEWQCELSNGHGNESFAAADTAARAICGAFLRLPRQCGSYRVLRRHTSRG